MLLRLVLLSQDIVDAIDVTVPIQILVQRSVHAKTNREVMKIEIPGTSRYLSFVDPSKNNIMFYLTSACAKRTGAAARVERRRRER